MQQVYIIKSRKKIFITSNINIHVRRFDDDDAMMIPSLARRCLPGDAASLSSFTPHTVVLPPSQRFLACVPHVVTSLASSCPSSIAHRVSSLACRVLAAMMTAQAHEYRRQGIG